jgi:sugar (pentulose or hexulose) kinase
MIPTLVTADASGGSTGPAITWEDARSEAQANQLLEQVGDLYTVTGQRVDGRYLLPMMARLASVDPDRVRRSAWLLGAKDFLFWWLTGRPATDPSTAAGFGAYELETGAWNGPAIGALDLLLDGAMLDLPSVRPATSRATVRGELATELGLPMGLEVCLGAADSVTGALGMGVDQRGAVAYIAGTSTVILAAADQPVLDVDRRYLVTPMGDEHLWGLEMDLLATGSAVRWLAGLAGVDEAELVRAACGRDPMSAPTFLPYLSPGEQGALWDPDLSGTLAGLSLGHDLVDVARGLISGVLVESRRCLRVLMQTLPNLEKVHAGGGGMTSREMAQELADVTGHPVVWSPGRQDHSAVGAAALAARSCDVRPNLSDSMASGVTLLPDQGVAPRWRVIVDRHDDLLTSVSGRS